MWLLLLDVHAGYGARDDEPLDLTSPLEDRVGIEVAHKFPRQGFFPNWADPQIREIDPFTGDLGRFCTRFVGSERAPRNLPDSIPVMSNTTDDTLASPPEGRLWAANDLVLYFGIKSVGELIKRHPDFPSPLPLRTRDRRWRPCDVIDWTNSLVSNTESAEMCTAIPEFDISTITDLLKET